MMDIRSNRAARFHRACSCCLNFSAICVPSMSAPSGNVVVRDHIVPFGPEGVDTHNAATCDRMTASKSGPTYQQPNLKRNPYDYRHTTPHATPARNRAHGG